MVDRLSMANQALQRIGSDPLQSEDEPNAGVYLAVYDSMEELFAADPWSFMMTTTPLVRLVAAPEQGYKYAYQLPPQRIGPPRAVYPRADLRHASTEFDIEGDHIVTDHDAIWLKWMRRRNPELWPGDFREAFRTALMAHYALSIREDRGLHDRLIQIAFGTPQEAGKGGLYGAALDNDNQSSPSVILGGGSNPLADARVGGGWRGRRS